MTAFQENVSQQSTRLPGPLIEERWLDPPVDPWETLLSSSGGGEAE